MQLCTSLKQSIAYILKVYRSHTYTYFSSSSKSFNSSLSAFSSFASLSYLLPSWFNWLLSSLGTHEKSSVEHILAVLHPNFLLDTNKLAKQISIEFVEILSCMCSLMIG